MCVCFTVTRAHTHAQITNIHVYCLHICTRPICLANLFVYFFLSISYFHSIIAFDQPKHTLTHIQILDNVIYIISLTCLMHECTQLAQKMFCIQCRHEMGELFFCSFFFVSKLKFFSSFLSLFDLKIVH